MKSIVTLHTDGMSVWTNVKGKVKVVDIDVENISGSSGELKIYFDESSWSIFKNGLIYSDETWIKELRWFLQVKKKYSRSAVMDIDYSEQGMQGDDYVSLDCGPKFLSEWFAKQAKKR